MTLIPGSVNFQPTGPVEGYARFLQLSRVLIASTEPGSWNKRFTDLTIQNSVDCPCCTSRDDQILGHMLRIYVWAHCHDIVDHTLRYRLARRTNRRISVLHLGLRAFFGKPHNSVLRAYTIWIKHGLCRAVLVVKYEIMAKS